MRSDIYGAWCARHCDKYFMYIISFNSPSDFTGCHFLDIKGHINSKGWILDSHPAVSDNKSQSF